MTRSQAELISRYEALRGEVLEEHSLAGGRGLALMMREGMAAWMEAWLSCPDSAPPLRDGPRNDESSLSCGTDTELVHVLVNMALSHLPECSP